VFHKLTTMTKVLIYFIKWLNIITHSVHDTDIFGIQKLYKQK